MTHSQYITSLQPVMKSGLKKRSFRKSVLSHLELVLTVILLNLDAVADILNAAYSPSERGRPRRDPVCMLRSLIIMTFERIGGITKWVEITRENDLLRILTGFNPDLNPPGVGTYYDFMKRIADTPYQKPCDHITRPSQLVESSCHKRNPGKPDSDEKEEAAPYQSLSDKLVSELLPLADQPRPDDFSKTADEILIRLGLIASHEEGLIGSNIVVSGDGSIMKTAASSDGRPSCDCRERGIPDCGCDRFYTSPTAQWCYDHHHNGYVFGDRYYHIVVTENGHDFPILTIMPGGNESDFTLSLKAIDRLLKALAENRADIRISAFCGDGHHDSRPHYRYLGEKDITPVIPLTHTGKKTVYPQIGNIQLNPDGIPICPGGAAMRHHGYNTKKGVHVYACPAKRSTHRDGKFIYVMHPDDCPRKQDCQPDSSVGPCVYVKSADDPRLFPPLARDTKKFRDIMKQRSASERINAVIDNYNISGRHRNAVYSLIRLILVSVTHHAVIRGREAAKSSSPIKIIAEMLNIGVGIFESEYDDTS